MANNKGKYTSIGGQALLEGIMMKGPKKTAMAVRHVSGQILTEETDAAPKKWYNKVPFIRGTANFVGQLLEGYKYITRSAELSGMMDEEDGEELSKFEKWLNDKFADKLPKLVDAIMVIMTVIMFAAMFVVFFFVPTWIFSLIQHLFGEIDISAFQSLIEGVLKMILFVVYMWLVAVLMKDIRRTYEYHGAEHKTIACYEAKLPLTVENVKIQKRFHPRCGTSFIFLVLFISILVYSVFPITNEMFMTNFAVTEGVAMILRTVCKLLLLPVIVGISYEVIKIAGKYDNIVTRIISAPGLCLQRLTTREPDKHQIEVAIEAMKLVIPENGEDMQ
ncbi:MAG: DUF1385 domain-containing protein [Ruminiclostridium sp.]|nr:DUF1385 domain-containing protein [Ruminiclostridium sp.]